LYILRRNAGDIPFMPAPEAISEPCTRYEAGLPELRSDAGPRGHVSRYPPDTDPSPQITVMTGVPAGETDGIMRQVLARGMRIVRGGIFLLQAEKAGRAKTRA